MERWSTGLGSEWREVTAIVRTKLYIRRMKHYFYLCFRTVTSDSTNKPTHPSSQSHGKVQHFEWMQPKAHFILFDLGMKTGCTPCLLALGYIPMWAPNVVYSFLYRSIRFFVGKLLHIITLTIQSTHFPPGPLAMSVQLCHFHVAKPLTLMIVWSFGC